MICHYCHKEGHYARCCFRKNQGLEEREEVYETEPEDYRLEEVRTAETSPLLVSLSVINTEIAFKVDSGKDCNRDTGIRLRIDEAMADATAYESYSAGPLWKD